MKGRHLTARNRGHSAEPTAGACLLPFALLSGRSGVCYLSVIREFTQPRQQWQQERHKFAYLTVKNNRFARFARAFFIFGHSADVLVLSTTWNYLFCSCEDDLST